MRIYSTELLAAVAFIACLSRCSTSGSKTVRPDVPSSGHPDGHEDDISDDTAHRNDEEESEARMPSPGETSALTERLQVMKRPESSGKLLQELDLTLRVGKDNDIEKIIEQLQHITANTNTKQHKVHELVKDCGGIKDGYTKLVSALRKVKADGLDVGAVEDEMFKVWKTGGVRPDSAFDFLEPDKLLERGGLTDHNVALLERYIKEYNLKKPNHPALLYATVLTKLKPRKLLPMIAQAGEKSRIATTVLMHFIIKMLQKGMTNKYVMELLLGAKMSESMIRHMLPILCKAKKMSLRHEEYLSRFMAALEKKLTSGWNAPVTTTKSSNDLSTKSSKRKVDTALTIGPAPARKKPASKS